MILENFKLQTSNAKRQTVVVHIAGRQDSFGVWCFAAP
jgi:hypothetical protein